MGSGERHNCVAATHPPGLPCGSAMPATFSSKQPAWRDQAQPRCEDGSVLPEIPWQTLVRALLLYVQPGTGTGCEPL